MVGEDVARRTGIDQALRAGRQGAEAPGELAPEHRGPAERDAFGEQFAFPFSMRSASMP
ncbi:hypothetical protein IGS68_32830 (plasmid) [Skermanella sp. TT6]|uniref:Uncharacterized protein n=1 Tax=Skermanella cutis TaxID=2775420 RepID=A0ABX7BGB7_9PROT|nr:hypothetical protein [Skermanella sp. TT6]QQP93412.1 hypothetical protein IGS68_32830 [Skermanella sp. TT6]